MSWPTWLEADKPTRLGSDMFHNVPELIVPSIERGSAPHETDARGPTVRALISDGSDTPTDASADTPLSSLVVDIRDILALTDVPRRVS